jgi:hypothetical protein
MCERSAITPLRKRNTKFIPLEKARIDVLRDVSSILESVYQDPVALYEVNAAILSEYYADEQVLLRDLLYPESSQLYNSSSFLSRKPRIGAFRQAFIETFN